MAQVHHGSVTTTAAVCRAIMHRQESLRALAKRYGINKDQREIEGSPVDYRRAGRSKEPGLNGADDR